MTVSMIVAMASGNVIGIENKLPWHLSADLKYFKSVTMGKPIIMGRKTFESIGRPLPGRRNLVITRDTAWSADGVDVFHTPEAALAAVSGVDEAMVIGGAEIYALLLPFTHKLYVTEVALDVKGDAHFPVIEVGDWRETSRDSFDAEDTQPAYSFVTYERCA